MEMGMGEFYVKFREDAIQDICLIIYTSFWVIA